jgi:hypothetical protein
MVGVCGCGAAASCWPVTRSKRLRISKVSAAALAVLLTTAIGAMRTAVAHADNAGQLLYQGGPVMHHETTHALFWDPAGSFSSTTKNLLTRYLADVAHDSGQTTNEFSVLEQYSDSSGSGSV